MWQRLILLSCLALAVFAEHSEERSPATVRIHHERSTDSELVASVDAFGETHHLKLTKVDLPSVPVYEITVGPNGTILTNNIPDDKSLTYYEDDSTGALLYMADDLLEGMLTDSIALRYEENEHVAAKITEKSSEHFCATKNNHKELEEPSVDKNENAVHDDNRALTYYPEILALFDSAIYRKFRSNSRMVAYATMFWKMVDKRFRTVQYANIYLRLAAIYYSTNTNVDNLFIDSGRNVDRTIEKLSRFMKSQRYSLKNHDISHLTTGVNLCQSSTTCSVTGVAWLRRPCYYTSTKALNTGLGEDNGFFNGVYTAAHEIGHNLGADHDGYGDSKSCSWNLGYMMSYLRINPRTAFFSSCSSTSMRSVYYQSYASCLRSISNTKYTWPSGYPGLKYSLDFQCQQRLRTSSARYNRSVSPHTNCYRLQCQYYSGGRWINRDTWFPALEGSQCYPGYYCSHGACRRTWTQ